VGRRALRRGYGLTETSPVTHANRGDARRKGSIGRPLEGVEAKIVDEDFEEVPRVEEGPIDEEEAAIHDITGELVIHGPNVMKEYYGLPEATTRPSRTGTDGKRWFHTGDIGYWDEDDFFYVVDREKHDRHRRLQRLSARSRGAPLRAPRRSRRRRRRDPGRAPRRDRESVHRPDSRRRGDPEDIKQYCLENLAEYKTPREVELVEELPRTTTGKVQKFELRDES